VLLLTVVLLVLVLVLVLLLLVLVLLVVLLLVLLTTLRCAPSPVELVKGSEANTHTSLPFMDFSHRNVRRESWS
jgi:hypothetical protein